MTQQTPPQKEHRLIVVGGGFGGLQTVQGLRKSSIQIKLIDRRNFHLFQPLLYQVAGGALSPANIAAPLRQILSRQKNCQVLMGEVNGINAQAKTVTLTDGTSYEYDTLVVAAGATHSYFGNDHWAKLAPGLKTIEDATEIRSRILNAFELAEKEQDAGIRRQMLTFVIVGAGPTGVELAGSLAEISNLSLRNDFRRIDPRESQIILVEGADRVLTPFPPTLSEEAKLSLKKLGVTVVCNTMVSNITDTEVEVVTGSQKSVIPTRTVLWAAGVKASPLAQIVKDATGAELDRPGRVIVNADLTVPGHDEIFVLGDIANYTHGSDRPLPGVAQVALQQGKFVAKLIKARLNGTPLPNFQYKNLGNLATIGRWSAVAEIGRFRSSGFTAWLIWLVIHLINIVNFRNRLLVLIQWGWNFLSYDRSARLITGESRSGNKAPEEEPDQRHPAELKTPAS